MQKRKLGKNGPQVSAVGLGCMGMSISYGEPDDEESVATMHRAIELGVNLVVTSDAYGNGVNEELIAKGIKGRRDKVLIATKFGNLALASRGGDGGAPALTGGHPDYVPQACDKSLKRLGVDTIDIYGMHRMDKTVPIEDTVGAMKRLVESGKVRFLQLSEAGAQTIRRAHKVHPIACVETEYSLWSRDVEKEILPACRELGIGYMAYAPLGRGFLTATMKTLDALLPKDRRREHPRFSPDNIAKNAELLAPLERIATAKKCTPAQIALAWLLAQGEDIVPIPGTKRRAYLEQNCAAADIKLTQDEVAALAKAFPLNVTAGTRYPEKQLAGLGI
ncbi:MAG: aldo/keto reductase [Betaproteobacteria bacterium RIFCSPLOWO2_02_FULL_67_26]|nr:MAG: aldo/keto reductase [Betaproteobacteria bacterium RIFCSPLOWO2_02_FULL_67_26]